MSNVSQFSVGLAHEFVVGIDKAGFTPKDLYALSMDRELLSQFLRVLRGEARVEVTKNLVDFDTFPSLPVGSWGVEEHKMHGKWKWNSDLLILDRGTDFYDHNRQKVGKQSCRTIYSGFSCRGMFVNANGLDYLLEHREAIPKGWIGKNVFFFGSIFRGKTHGTLYVRFLGWHNHQPCKCQRKLDDQWNEDDYIVFFHGCPW
jgi:hypothetical protein